MDIQKEAKKEMKISLNPDQTPIFYTDNIFMSLNEDGVVLDVCQKVGATNQMRVVTRVGMSKNHAQKFVKKLESLLLGYAKKTQTGEKIVH